MAAIGQVTPEHKLDQVDENTGSDGHLEVTEDSQIQGKVSIHSLCFDLLSSFDLFPLACTAIVFQSTSWLLYGL